jgi:hypothetical protein
LLLLSPRPTLKRILDSGHSRLPVFRGSDRSDLVGLILVKELLAVVGLAEPGSGPVGVSQLRMRDLPALVGSRHRGNCAITLVQELFGWSARVL